MVSKSKRRTILTDIEIEELYGPPRFNIEQQRFYFTLNEYEQTEFDEIEDRHSKIYFVLLLGYFKLKPVVLNFTYSQIKSDFSYVAEFYFHGRAFKQRNLSAPQKSRLYKRVLKLQRYTSFTDKYKEKLQVHALQTATISVDPRSILDEMIHYLSRNNVTIPKYTILQRITISAIEKTNQSLFDIANRFISESLGDFIEDLCHDKSEITLKNIKREAKDFSQKEIDKELSAMLHLKPYISEIEFLVQEFRLSQYNVSYYASLVDYYSITRLRRFARDIKQLYLLCYLKERYKIINEHMADAFDYHCRRLKENAKQYAKEEVYIEWASASQNIGKASALLRFFIDDSLGDNLRFGRVKEQAYRVMTAEEIDSVCLYLADEKRTPEYYHWQYYDRQKELVCNMLRPLFMALEFKPSDSTKLLYHQIEKTKLDLSEYNQCHQVDRRLIKPKLQPFIAPGEDIDPHRFEVLLYLQIKSKLNGHIFIKNTEKYSALTDDLVSDKTWKGKENLIRESRLDRLQVPPKQLLEDLENLFHTKLDNVAERIQNGDNHSVVMRDRSGKRGWRLPNKRAGSLLNNPFFEKIKQIHIVELLRFVDRQTGYLNAFEHVRVPQAHSEVTKNNLVAAIIGNGTNYGLHRMAHISDRSYDELRQIQANYIRLETLNVANDIITNAIAKLPIFEHYNIQPDEMHASIDGQKFECRISTFKTRYSSKYFGTNKGVSAVSIVANHVPINAKVIGANEHESHFVFDLLFNNTSDIKPTVLSSDTHGTNQVNFALLDMFGYTFAPRYANISKVIDSLFTLSNSDNKPLLKLKKPIKAGYIVKEWETIQRIVISLQQKTTTQSALVRKLSTYSPTHPLIIALAEYDRLIKSMYLLDYIDDESLRNYVQRALNRGEAYHQLRRAIASVNGNRFRGGGDGEIELWNECARLLANAVIYFNSLVLSNLLAHFKDVNDEAKLEIVKQVSPVAWVNINLNGTYSFSFDEELVKMEDIISPITSETEGA